MECWQKPLPEGVKPIEQGRHFDPGYDGIACFDVTTAEWEHVCSARFGEGRPCGFNDTTKWTGDSYRYDIYRRGISGKTQYALRWWNGGGQGWLIGGDNERNGEACLLPLIASVADENRRWDYCHFLWETAHKTACSAAADMERKYQQAFVDGRLKKRKRKGKYTVEIVQPLAISS